ncbi:hypothetical protein Q4Q39_08750 [Flavivirga amylovorans]|uniref:Uncharacterized protein n=1 Tax=Flavivirga amylovorans TaxID=870486 RepID=A0ABT8X0K9_9FLAO|nr:hypothetical protein [Flavivirga amylovorans]MDO5987482.1 hypothetical protein [Flavivirga amylovorans]
MERSRIIKIKRSRIDSLLNYMLSKTNDFIKSWSIHNDYNENTRVSKFSNTQDDLIDTYSSLQIKYHINTSCILKVMDYKLIENSSFKYEKRNGFNAIPCRFYYTLTDRKQKIVDKGALLELRNFPSLKTTLFNIEIPLRNHGKRINIYRDDTLLISHLVPTSEMKTKFHSFI